MQSPSTRRTYVQGLDRPVIPLKLAWVLDEGTQEQMKRCRCPLNRGSRLFEEHRVAGERIPPQSMVGSDHGPDSGAVISAQISDGRMRLTVADPVGSGSECLSPSSIDLRL